MKNVNRCNSCSAEVLRVFAFDNWKKMINFIEFLEAQGLITNELSQEMFECMMSFKEYAVNEDDKERKEWEETEKPKKKGNK